MTASSSNNPAADPHASPVPFAFVEGALDRADALRDDPAALAALWPQARVVLLDDDGRALADAAQGLFAPDGNAIGGGPGTAIFLGLRDRRGWFAQRAATVVPSLADAAPQRVDLRSAAAAWPAFDATVFAQARALLHWHARHRYCGACGGELDFVRAGWLGRCRRCGSDHYPRTDQAIIAAVTDGTRLLLGRQATWPARRWSVLAGFVEPGESLEQTVAREVLEETGVRVRSCHYLASQPWPFPGALMLGFLAQADADTPVAGDELEDARWFDAASVRAGLAHDWGAPPDAAPEDAEGIVLSSPISIARWLAERWLATQPD
jgi:NAD+ diphosphatase